MRLSELRYPLGPENIASEPHEVRLGRRDLGRMMIVDRASHKREHSHVARLPELLNPGDVLVLNDSKRIPGVLKLRTVKENAQVEIRFSKIDSDGSAVGRAFPTHFLDIGVELATKTGRKLTVRETGVGPHSLYRVVADAGFETILKEEGLPITSFFYQGYWDLDNYNNCFAASEGSLESPMAGLHFTPELLAEITRRGVTVCFVTLHVVGSWLAPISDEATAQVMSTEPYLIPEVTARAVTSAHESGNRVLACGTTVVRALESAAQFDGRVDAGRGATSLCVSPGYTFRVVDMYFTNFHPSSSSLILLDAAFCDKDLLLSSYAAAREAGYLFFEFGDAVLYV
jgi:S-adenosylmethionine:tRNA ribosyltransferase-isomerase